VTVINNSALDPAGFTRFTDPYISDVGVTSPFAPPAAIDGSYFDWNGALDGLDEGEFALLMRTVELVVQAQTFSCERLQLALQISSESATRMTRSLELLGIISAGEPKAQRRVLVSVRTLPVLLAKLLSGRDRLPGLVSPAELRIAS
jgi:DNA segregation ATPase FtsK/SpoIIIE-like protein